MGAGGRTMAPGRPASDESKTTGPGCLPVDKPPFTLAKIKWAIPPHCFHRSVLKSSSYLLRDVAAVAVLLCFAMALIPNLPSPLRLAAWPVYWVAQGCALGELWVLAHECGHHTFSGHALLDDAVGFALHTALLVPYFSWKHSHRRHHANSDSLDRDEVFVQRRKAQLSPLAGRVHRSAAGRLATLFFRPRGERHRPVPFIKTRLFRKNTAHEVHTLAACYPTARQVLVHAKSYYSKHYKALDHQKFPNLHHPASGGHQVDCARPSLDASRASHSPSVSLIGPGARAGGPLRRRRAGLRLPLPTPSWAVVARVYGVPLVVVNAWLVLVTYLQHTHPVQHQRVGLAPRRAAQRSVPQHHRHARRAPPLPGAAALPRRREATPAVRPVLGEYYRFDATPVAEAPWRAVKECVYVEPDARRDGVFCYANKF
ncbi:hypothetical protein QOZ80_6AG0519300 [Eleusine coracana subsp. coracana]|nr:hypothetical protein QOZ80_6AG0519300 [Eleusine coracana subsp. coracana]